MKSQQTALHETPVQEPTQVDQMQQGGTQQTSTASSLTHVRCQYCGRDAHRKDRCPARNATCFKCQKRGHFANVCQSGKVEQVHSQKCERADTFLDTIGECEESFWLARVLRLVETLHSS